MDGYRKRYIAVSREDYDGAEAILNMFYNRGDIDSITVAYRAKCDPVLIGLECSTDDLEDIMTEMRKVGIVVM